MTPIPLEEPTKKDNEKLSIKKNNPKPLCQYTKEQQNRFNDEFLKLTLGEVSNKLDEMKAQFDLEDSGVIEDELIHKRMNDINTFQAHENEVYLRGTDEYGKDFQICFDSYNFLEWIDTEHLKYIKEQLTKYIKSK